MWIMMSTKFLLLLTCLSLLVLNAILFRPAVPGAEAAPVTEQQVFSSPINAACVQVAPSECKLHFDPFTIQISPGATLEAFQLQANDKILYDFRTDLSNPPMGSYSPSLVKLGYAATCGKTYTVNLLARDSGDPGFLNIGQAENIVCPQGTYDLHLPVMLKRP
jgi:hypothetical protein